MEIQTAIYISIIVLLAFTLAFYFSPKYTRKVLVTAEGPFSLSSHKTIISDQESKSYYSDGNGSFSAFVYLSPMNRTGVFSSCGTNPNQASCTDGVFAPCPCDAIAGDCSVCNHSGYNQVFSIAGIVSLEVLNAPDASRQGKAMSQLIIKTEGAPLSTSSTASQKYIETLSLPPIPLQKWTMVSVAREGRRFDVYYDDKMVLSQKAMYMPISNISNSNFKGITSGSDGLIGHIAMANVYNYRLSSQIISVKYNEYADTRGRPYINSSAVTLTAPAVAGTTPVVASTTPSTTINTTSGTPATTPATTPSTPATTIAATLAGLNPYTAFASISFRSFIPSLPSFNICPADGCFKAPTISPASPLYKWSSIYE